MPVPSPTPETEATPLPPDPFADELPPDFWGDALEPPDTLQAAPDERLETSGAPPAHPGTTKPLAGTLESDPRFVLLQELFPGHISNWQSAEAPSGAAEEEVDDAPEPPETVDLAEGLDTDEGD